MKADYPPLLPHQSIYCLCVIMNGVPDIGMDLAKNFKLIHCLMSLRLTFSHFIDRITR